MGAGCLKERFLHGLRVYSRHSRFLGEDWERRRVEERLKRLAEKERAEQ